MAISKASAVANGAAELQAVTPEAGLADRDDAGRGPAALQSPELSAFTDIRVEAVDSERRVQRCRWRA